MKKYRFFFTNAFWNYGYIVNNSGNFVELANWAYSDFIGIERYGGNILFSYLSTSGGCFYDADYKYISGFGGSGTNVSIPIPSGAKYMRCNMQISDIANGTASAVQEHVGVNMLERTECFPNYKDDLAKDYELETNQRFYRAKLSGKITFIRNDWKYIKLKPFDNVFNLIVEITNDYGQTYEPYYKCQFMKTDCTFNDDDKTVEVQPETVDEYNNVLAGLEKEYNLIELAPEIQFVNIKKRPLIQIYVPGDSIVSCFLGGTNWEQDANAVTDQNALVHTYYFALCNVLKEIQITGDTNPNVNGLYTGRLTEADKPGSLTGKLYSPDNNDYYINVTQGKIQGTPFGAVSVAIVRISDDKILYSWTRLTTGEPFDILEFDIPAADGSGATGTAHADMKSYNVYARYLCDVDKIDDLNTYPIPSSDIVDNNRNYHRAIGYAIDVAYLSNRYSDEPTPYGRADNDKYFVPPYSIYGQKFYPIARSTWRYASLWFGFYMFDWIEEKKARKTYTLRDTYSLASCINVLLRQFAPEIKHEATPEYSQFLYSSNNPISNWTFRLFISQKSNIVNGEYQTPAQKAPITLQQITNMLRDTFKCYWYIEDGKFKIEQIKWFLNGGSYSSTPIIGYDLTELENVRNGKKWAFATSEYSFDKVDMAERFQFEWMDDVTEPFEGLPIEVTSKYVTAGKIEEINISNFTSDIDLMLLNPSAISPDGFALFAAVQNGTTWELPFTKQTVDGADYYLQNGFLAYINIQPIYWLYDMPAKNLIINGTGKYAISIERKKKQTINFPAGKTEPNPMQLVKTFLGYGQVDKLSVNLCSRSIKATLKYDTE